MTPYVTIEKKNLKGHKRSKALVARNDMNLRMDWNLELN